VRWRYGVQQRLFFSPCPPSRCYAAP
jgi:hypothetical protein